MGPPLPGLVPANELYEKGAAGNNLTVIARSLPSLQARYWTLIVVSFFTSNCAFGT
jgi:hypothetical protein